MRYSRPAAHGRMGMGRMSLLTYTPSASIRHSGEGPEYTTRRTIPQSVIPVLDTGIQRGT